MLMIHTSDSDEHPSAKKCIHWMLPLKRPIFTSCSNWLCDRARLFHFVSIEATGVNTFGPSYTRAYNGTKVTVIHIILSIF